MFCGNCGKNINDDNKFCISCGNKVGTVDVNMSSVKTNKDNSNSGNGLRVTSIILGVLSIVNAIILIFSLFGIIYSVIGFIISIFAFKKGRNILGVVLNVVGFILSIFAFIVLVVFLRFIIVSGYSYEDILTVLNAYEFNLKLSTENDISVVEGGIVTDNILLDSCEKTEDGYTKVCKYKYYNDNRQRVEISSGEEKIININLKNVYDDTIKYGIYYKLLDMENLPKFVEITKGDNSLDELVGVIEKNETRNVSIRITNNSKEDIIFRLGSLVGDENSNIEDLLDDGEVLIK